MEARPDGKSNGKLHDKDKNSPRNTEEKEEGLAPMDKKQVQHIIRTMAQQDLLDFLLDRANLTRKEREIIECGVRLDNTQEEAAERLERSARWVQVHEKLAYAKLVENWNGIGFLERF